MTAYSVYFNKRHHRVGRLTQGRFAAQLVEGNEYVLKLSRYIHLNPVCGKRWKGVPLEQRQKELRSYVWSTYRSYAGLEAEWPYVDYGPVRALVEERLKSDYATYVETGIAGDDAEFTALYRRARLSLGSGKFTERVRQAHEEVVRKAGRAEEAAGANARHGGDRIGSWSCALAGKAARIGGPGGSGVGTGPVGGVEPARWSGSVPEKTRFRSESPTLREPSFS